MVVVRVGDGDGCSNGGEARKRAVTSRPLFGQSLVVVRSSLPNASRGQRANGEQPR